MKTPSLNRKKFLIATLAVLLVVSLGYGGYSYWQLRKLNIRLGERISDLRGSISAIEADLARVKGEKSELTLAFTAEQNKNSDLSATLQTEQDKNKIFEAQIRDISITVGGLKKLSETDEELLKKYSRVYFLNENYAPIYLSAIDSQYLYNANKPQLIHAGVAGPLQAMLATAARDEVTLKVVSAHRSFAEQAAVKTGNEILYGSGANQFSADQGYSEHQLGTTVDLTTDGLNGISLGFEDKAAYKWLVENAFRFGFILSYPKDNLYYHSEPWHWRFVGISLATKLHNENKYFYELSQREVDEYLISVFD